MDMHIMAYYVLVWNITIASFVIFKESYLYVFEKKYDSSIILCKKATFVSTALLTGQAVLTGSLIVILANAVFYFFTQRSLLPFFP